MQCPGIPVRENFFFLCESLLDLHYALNKFLLNLNASC